MQKTRNRDVIWYSKRMAIGMALSCLFAFGDNRLLHETPPSYWETNLVATVIGYTGQRTFMGTVIPEMDPSGQAANDVWLYSIAPTNYAHITFSLHKCGPWSLASVYPTNQLFVFPASVCSKQVSTSIMLSGKYSEPIVPSPTIQDYCPYRTFEKWFPITDNQTQFCETYLQRNMETSRKRVEEWRDELKNASDEKRRAHISHLIEYAEREIQSLQREIEDCKHQPTYFKNRIEWFKTQGFNPTPQTTTD